MTGSPRLAHAPLPQPDLDEAVDRDADLWEDFRGASVLVTGGTGFVGSWMVATLRRASARFGLGCTITIPTRDPDAQRLRRFGLDRAPDVVLLRADVRDPLPVCGPFTHAVHAATDASARLNAERPLEMLDTIIQGTRQVLACLDRDPPRRLLLISSGAVYGKGGPAAIGEDCRFAPDQLAAGSAYGEGKRVAELLCATRGRGAPAPHTTIARCFAFVGPLLPLDAHFAIGNFIRDGLAGGPIVVQGDGTAVRSYLYAGDLAAWLWRIMVRGRHLQPYNVGADEGLDMRSIATLVATRCPGQPAVEIRGAAGSGPVDRYLPCTALARRELGLEAWTSLPSAIDRTLAWHRRAG